MEFSYCNRIHKISINELKSWIPNRVSFAFGIHVNFCASKTVSLGWQMTVDISLYAGKFSNCTLPRNYGAKKPRELVRTTFQLHLKIRSVRSRERTITTQHWNNNEATDIYGWYVKTANEVHHDIIECISKTEIRRQRGQSGRHKVVCSLNAEIMLHCMKKSI